MPDPTVVARSRERSRPFLYGGRAHPLLLLSLLIAALVALPIIGVLSNLFVVADAEAQTFTHLWQTVLPEYILNSLTIALIVTVLTAVIGIGCAWLVAVFDFPGRKLFEWALILPLAMPAYVVAYAYTDFLQFTGPIQSGLRELFGWQGRSSYWFPEVRSVSGAGILFAFILYPYVYLIVRNAFLERSPRMWDAARTLGAGPWRAFMQVSLPLARPAAAAGIALALMETLADYGAVSYFGVQTLTTGIYKSWYIFSDRTAAAQIAGVLLLTVMLLMFLEQKSRGRARYYAVGARSVVQPRAVLRGRHAVGAGLFCALPILIGFVTPLLILVHLLIDAETIVISARYVEWLRNTILLGGVTAVIAVIICVVIAYAARIAGGTAQRICNRIVGMGYAIPGAVIAVGILIPIARMDQWSSEHGVALVLSGSVIALIYAYLVRFLAVSLQSVQAGLLKITPSMDASARSLGHGPASMLMRVHAPLLWRSVLTAGLLVFVDVVKELPATLTIRPFNFDTLAVITHQLASDERLGEAALPAFTIVLIAMVPVMVLARAIASNKLRS
ncbi:ABC transporter permease [Oxalicibacterium faecigallinarum]|uniref:Iron(III) ABC transporter permease n=1 Tax=Oxalicibacterium faecigallinarum TaxID=573741 RepID=A0A8J3F3Q5_9BURK|nr:iron ABC transporter permease [Oxalicibacterium faecigallinarum]GGI20686.1 iron(III) ABC transporter permease [Oxalicibacterium faecigallinarum]